MTDKEKKGSNEKSKMGKSKTERSRAMTPLPTDASRILEEIQRNGQAVHTDVGTLRFVDKKTGIETKDYYHGLLPSEDIRHLLSQNGDYCVRTTEIKSAENRQKCLSVKWEEKIRNFLLYETSSKTWTLDLESPKTPQFGSLECLIDFYADRRESFSQFHCRLFTPVRRQGWEFRHSQIELELKLGEGAFGEVYLGYVNKKNKRHKVAIKTLKCAQVSKEKIEQSMKEVRLMRPIIHPNIVRFYGVAAEEEPVMIVMEYVKGGSLDAYLIQKNEDVSIEEREKMCIYAASALSYLHRKGILHRDIASRNCLYFQDCLKISDFGMAVKALSHQMKTNDRVPVRWMAPEVFIEQKHTAPSDVWALGVLIWEIFCNGREPYEGWAGAKVKNEVLKNGFRLSLPIWAPQHIKELLKKIWVADPMKRITSRELAHRLKKISPRTTVSKYDTTVEVTKEAGEDSGVNEDELEERIDDKKAKQIRKEQKKIAKKGFSREDGAAPRPARGRQLHRRASREEISCSAEEVPIIHNKRVSKDQRSSKHNSLRRHLSNPKKKAVRKSYKELSREQFGKKPIAKKSYKGSRDIISKYVVDSSEEEASGAAEKKMGKSKKKKSKDEK